jgi:hypothetical protein
MIAQLVKKFPALSGDKMLTAVSKTKHISYIVVIIIIITSTTTYAIPLKGMKPVAHSHLTI